MLAGLTFEGKKQTKMRPPMRSSIACLRCRKSKIKCENNGGTSPCDSCLKTGKDCVFKMPEANPTPPKRSEPPASLKQERDGGSDRKKLKKIDDLSRMDNEKATLYADEVLSAPFLTEDIWEQVLDLYKLHFAPELPFLHLPTLKEKLGRRFRNPEPEPSPDLNLVLLGVLTLTARYHTDLVKYLAHICNSQGGNARSRPLQTQIIPSAASEYYAETLTRALGSTRTAMGLASVERVQAFLMLGLYEWGQTQPNTGGLGAWMLVGTAIRMAQFLKLGFMDKDSKDLSSRSHGSRSSGSLSRSQMTLEREVKRRTFFSCFILDRMLACGKDRLSVISPNDLIIRLPSSEDKFDLAMEAHTGFIEDRGDKLRGTDDSVLSQFIRLVKLWGEISRYSVAGGRLVEHYPPWDQRTAFRRLREELMEFEDDLPDTFRFSRSNYFKHENHQASSVYVLLHMLRNVCLIMLHREYIPFVPVRCNEPEGPLDRPTFPKDEARREFWLESAEQVFKAAREIVDLIEICQKKDKLPQSTIVVFAIWTAAFVGLYAIHFPRMDVKRHMLSHTWNEPPPDDTEVGIFTHGPTGLTYTTLSKMSGCLTMASTYVGVLEQMDNYFEKIKRDVERHDGKNKSLGEKTTLSLRDGGRGGGLEEYQPILPYMKDFSSLYPNPMDHTNIESLARSRASTIDRASSVGTESHLASAIERSRTPRSSYSASFTAINHAPTSAGHHDSNGNGAAGHRPEGTPGTSHEAHIENWNRYPNNTIRPHQSPSQAYNAPGGSMLDPAATAAQAVGYGEPEFELEDHISKRFANTNDMGILTQNFEPWVEGEFPFFDLAPDTSFTLPPQPPTQHESYT